MSIPIKPYHRRSSTAQNVDRCPTASPSSAVNGDVVSTDTSTASPACKAPSARDTVSTMSLDCVWTTTLLNSAAISAHKNRDAKNLIRTNCRMNLRCAEEVSAHHCTITSFV